MDGEVTSDQCITFVSDFNDGGDINGTSLVGVSVVALTALLYEVEAFSDKSSSRVSSSINFS
eukprot:CAMPEP_0172522922 /NCGR_PEP_ID=MMETSP1066-20121228/293386_1 /TAXON_ID=671091 /ORGANISM="Coscinodiscus wailesii, Strain CCMP2513" /LENGTH=61 /DNA_ID=CAMNT_0013305961 /DNA_START=567 /DNA_END=748 /DNA_ORIENTATION=+